MGKKKTEPPVATAWCRTWDDERRTLATVSLNEFPDRVEVTIASTKPVVIKVDPR